MSNLPENLKETVQWINEQTGGFQPEAGIVLGSGLGKLAGQIDTAYELAYDSIPHFPVSTVKGHAGRLVFGTLGRKRVVAMAGRFHFYEGYSGEEVGFPIRVMRLLGIDALFLSNAAGSLNPDILIGDLCIIRDHINLQPDHPLRGKNYPELGPRFPDMFHSYDNTLIERGLAIAHSEGYRVNTGVYVGVQGPTLETPAEYKYLHIIGGDMVGMSTVSEVIVARHMGLRVFVVSVSTDQGYPPEVIKELTHEDVIRVANEAEPKVTRIITELIEGL